MGESDAQAAVEKIGTTVLRATVKVVNTRLASMLGADYAQWCRGQRVQVELP